MSRPSLYARDLVDRLDFALLTVTQLSQILMDNGSYKGASDLDEAPQIDDLGESAIQSAIHLIADMARRDPHELVSDLEIPA